MAFDKGVAVDEEFNLPSPVVDKLKETLSEGVLVMEDPSHPGFARISFS